MHLNTQQKLAVESVNGPLLILAGAGTGKTKTLVCRIAHIVQEEYASPSQIMAVTFTNKAAKEMTQRVKNMVGDVSFNWVGTFHSIAAKILRINAEKIGLKSDFVILDQEDQIKMIKQIAKDLNMQADKTLLRQFCHKISGWKDKAWTPKKVIQNNGDTGWLEKQSLRIYELYQKKIIANNAADFGDLLMHNITIFDKEPEVLKLYQEKFLYLMVDEYQDTNLCQYLWLGLLAKNHKNICCVGDDDQSIYGWRGAQIGNILRFSKDFADAKTIRLEQNYRSTSKILDAAHKIISKNNTRLGKKLWTSDNTGQDINIITFKDGEEEARLIINLIKNKINDCQLQDVAVLVRAGFQTRAFEDACIKQQIPYRVVGGLKFYERKEVKDVISYLRLVVNTQDNIAFDRIANCPKRGVGGATLAKIQEFANITESSMFSALCQMLKTKEIKNQQLDAFAQGIKSWQDQLHTKSLQQVLKTIVLDSGYIEMLKKADEEERIENVAEIFRTLDQFESAVEFLEHISLTTDSDKNIAKDAINIMTLHSSKGLEFDYVFLPGWEEGVFPHTRSLASQEQIEEERRLAYVGITRAKKHLTITHAIRRLVHNQWQSPNPSRFLKDLEDRVNAAHNTDGKEEFFA